METRDFRRKRKRLICKNKAFILQKCKVNFTLMIGLYS